MGCQDSTPPPVVFSNPNAFFSKNTSKRPTHLSLTLLSPQKQESIWPLIQLNKLRELAYSLEADAVPPTVEITSTGTYWSLVHLCCRWDAVDCLLYVLKKVYAEVPKSFTAMLNMQTVEGTTPIMLCVVWNAVSCLHALLDVGGIDLSYRDQCQSDVFALCQQYRRGADVIAVLEMWRRSGKMLTSINRDRVAGAMRLQEIIDRDIFPTGSFRMSQERINQLCGIQSNIPNIPPIKPVQQVTQQKPIQSQISEQPQIKATIPQQPKQAIETHEQIFRETSAEEAKGQLNNIVDEEERRYQERIRQKQKDLDFAKMEALRKKREAEMEMDISNRKLVQKEAILDESKLQRINQEKELIRRNIENIPSRIERKSKHVIGKTALICPEDIKPLYESAVRKCVKFTDMQFPPELKTLGDVNKFKPGWQDCQWIRPEEYFQNGYELFEGISPEDIKQGGLGVCYYLAALSSLAQVEKRVKSLFRFYDIALGFYAVQFYVSGKRKTVIIDDYFPVFKGIKQPLFATPNGNQIWAIVLEKAWVKMFGSYLAAENMQIQKMLGCVCPAPTAEGRIDSSNAEEVFATIFEQDKQNSIVLLTVPEVPDLPAGVVPKHAYSLLAAYNYNGEKVYKVRNPWGHTEYGGDYSESSPKWTEQLKKITQFKGGNDGIFYVSHTELYLLFCSYAICYYREGYEYSYEQFSCSNEEQLFYSFTVKQPCQLSIQVTQRLEKLTPGVAYETAPFVFELSEISADGHAVLIFQGQYMTQFGYEHCWVHEGKQPYAKYKPGRYLLRIFMHWDRAFTIASRNTMRKPPKYSDGIKLKTIRRDTAVISAYGPTQVLFTKLSQEEGIKYFRDYAQEYILRQGKSDRQMEVDGQDEVDPSKRMTHVFIEYGLMRGQAILYLRNNISKPVEFNISLNPSKLRNLYLGLNCNKEAPYETKVVVGPCGGWQILSLHLQRLELLAIEGTTSLGETRYSHKAVK